MDFERYHVYVVEGAEAMAKVDAYRQHAARQRANANEWARKHGGIEPLHRGQFLSGITTAKGAHPNGKGWVVMEHQPDPDVTWWKYNWRSKAGKAIEREINSEQLRQPTAVGLADAIGAGSHYIDLDRRLHQAQAWNENGVVFLIVPKQEGVEVPDFDGCRRLKLSEFYAMKEEADSAPASAGGGR